MNFLKWRGFRDRDFLGTKDGFLFCVVGPYHPCDRVIGYLKYLPDSQGMWRKRDNRFRRVMKTYTIPSLLDTFDFLKDSYPQYLFFSSVYSITMAAVPKEYIVDHFKPEEKLGELFRKSSLDYLQKKVVGFVSLLSEISAVPPDHFGVTGSILLDIHSPAFSDMDITVYGVANSYAVKEALTKAYLNGNSNVKRFEGGKLEKWYLNKTRDHPVSLAEATRIYERKWNVGTFRGTLFSVHPVMLEKELTEKYGDKAYSPAGTITINAVVTDSKYSIFLPALYKVGKVDFDKEFEVKIEEVVTYEGFYDSLAEKGDLIEVRGKLERVVDNLTGNEYGRVLVGSPEGKGREYIKLK